MNRRELIATLASAAALPFMSACIPEREPSHSSAGDADAIKVLNDVGENLLRLFPEVATQLGLDTGPREVLRSQLMDRSTAGREHIANVVRGDLARVKALDT